MISNKNESCTKILLVPLKNSKCYNWEKMSPEFQLADRFSRLLCYSIVLPSCYLFYSVQFKNGSIYTNTSRFMPVGFIKNELIK